MNESVVIFGGSGFIGTHMIRRLVSEGKFSIISIDLLPPRERYEGVEYQIADVRDLKALSVPENTNRFYHFAAVHRTPGHSQHEYYETNVLGAIEVTNLAASCSVNEVIFTSSISVYGPGEDTKSEQTALSPKTAYGYSKMLAERIFESWAKQHASRRLTIVRPAVVFGPGEKGNFTRLVGLLKKGIFVYPGRRDTIKACIYVDDLIESIEFARNNSNDAVTIFNGAYPQRYTLEQIVETLIAKHVPDARTVMMPKSIVMGTARLLGSLDALHLGIHPDRVMKLVRSTDVEPGWLSSRGREFPDAIEKAFDAWSQATHGRFD